MSGYDLAQAAERLAGRFWPGSRSQVYAELARLKLLGLVHGAEIAQDRRPDRRLFHLSGQGEQALDSRLESPDLAEPRFRLPFLLETLLGHRTAPGRTAALPREVRADVLAQARDRGALAAVTDYADAAYARLTVSFLVRLAETMAARAADAEAARPAGRLAIDPRRASSTGAAAIFAAVPRGSA
jgi:DNA-binding PadR family transcriptional regulator